MLYYPVMYLRVPWYRGMYWCLDVCCVGLEPLRAVLRQQRAAGGSEQESRVPLALRIPRMRIALYGTFGSTERILGHCLCTFGCFTHSALRVLTNAGEGVHNDRETHHPLSDLCWPHRNCITMCVRGIFSPDHNLHATVRGMKMK